MPDSHTNEIARANVRSAVIPRAVINAALRSDCINLCHINIQSLCARQMSKFDEFKMCFTDSKVDIICVSETWLTTDISDSMVALDAQYKRLRNRVTTLINKAKSDYFSMQLNSINSSKVLWKKLKQINVAKSSSHCVQFNNSCDEINNFFGENFTRDFELPPIPSPNYGGFKFLPCYEHEVAFAINSIDSNAIGLDGIPLKFIKCIMPYIIAPITYIFNLIIKTSKFPGAWKAAKVVPIRKKPGGADMNNLRPISILCSLSKAFEKVIKKQIQEYIESFDLLSQFQSGFRANHSTKTALLKVHDDIHSIVDKKGLALLILIDFSKAFDRVSHVKLLKKMSSQFNFSGEAVNLIGSYLNNRYQVVEIDGIYSNPISILSGVPQGSVLGPLLFSLFINDLPTMLKYCKVHMFADDVQLYLCSSQYTLDELARLVNADLANILNWSTNNLLPINSTKTKAMLISRHHRRLNIPNIYLGTDSIVFVNKISNLGVIFTQNFEWDAQVNAQCGKLYAGLRHLKITASMLPKMTKINLFKSLLLPHLMYGAELIINASARAINKLRVALNCCIRWVFKLNRYSRVTQFHKQLLGCQFGNFLKLRCYCSLHKIINFGPNYLRDKLLLSQSTRVRNYILPQHNTSHYSGTFFVRAIVWWNQIPTVIKTIVSPSRFHHLCIEWLNERN